MFSDESVACLELEQRVSLFRVLMHCHNRIVERRVSGVGVGSACGGICRGDLKFSEFEHLSNRYWRYLCNLLDWDWNWLLSECFRFWH